MTQIKTSPPSVTVLQPLSIQHETRVRLPLPESICVAVTVKPVRATVKNKLETAQPLSTLIQKGLRSIVKRYRTVFVALSRAALGLWLLAGAKTTATATVKANFRRRLTLNDADQRPRLKPKRRI